MSGLYYPVQQSQAIIGSKSGTTRTPSTLTDDYANNNGIMTVGGASKITLDILYTMGATETSNSITVKVEESPDGTNYYQLSTDTTSGGTSTLAQRVFSFTGADGAAASISIGLDVFYKHSIKVSVLESGVVTNAGTIYVEGTTSGK